MLFIVIFYQDTPRGTPELSSHSLRFLPIIVFFGREVAGRIVCERYLCVIGLSSPL